MKCVLCWKNISGYGNNAEPLAKGRCCDKCNPKVLHERVTRLLESLKKAEVK